MARYARESAARFLRPAETRLGDKNKEGYSKTAIINEQIRRILIKNIFNNEKRLKL